MMYNKLTAIWKSAAHHMSLNGGKTPVVQVEVSKPVSGRPSWSMSTARTWSEDKRRREKRAVKMIERKGAKVCMVANECGMDFKIIQWQEAIETRTAAG